MNKIVNTDLSNSDYAPWPARVTLQGRFVSVVPLDPDAHGRALFENTGGGRNEHLWTYMPDGPYFDYAVFDAQLRKKIKSEDPLFFAILDHTVAAKGYATYMRIEPAHRCIEVGNIMYGPELQRTPAGTEAMYLMARYVFEDLAYRRYEWKCNALNAPSRRAALRYGFTFEGIFRQHMIVKGRNRDTAWFAMLDHEWPERKRGFEAWLSPDNFDAEGRQRTSLSALNRCQ